MNTAHKWPSKLVFGIKNAVKTTIIRGVVHVGILYVPRLKLFS